MTILFLDPVGTLGGAERSLLDLVASLRSARPDLRIALISGEDGALVSAASKLGVDVQVVPLPVRLSRVGDSAIHDTRTLLTQAWGLALAGTELLQYRNTLGRAIAGFRPSVVHSNGMKMHALAAMSASRDIPVVWHLRDYVGSRALMRPALRGLSSRAAAIIAISRSVADDAARALARKDVTVIYNAVDVGSCFTPEGGSVDLDGHAGMQRSSAVVRVGLVATYARWKGHEVFLEAASLLRAEHPELRFFVVGGAAYSTEGSQFTEDELRAEIEQRGLARTVGLVPFQEAPDQVYRALDIVVHASTRPEPFGRTIVEAMACGRAVIIANEGGAAELIDDGIDAVAVPPRDPHALASALASLATNPPLRMKLGVAARSTATTRFARERLASELLAVYRRVGAL